MGSDFQSEQSSFLFEQEPGQGGHSGLDVRRMLRLRLPLMIGVFLLVAIPSSVVVMLVTPVEYRASAQLRFLASAPHVLKDAYDRAPGASYEKFVNTQVDLITGPAILSRVADDPEIREIDEIADEEDRVAFLESRIDASVRRDSELVEVSMRLRDGAQAAQVLEKIVDQYVEYALGEEASTDSERLRILMKERDTRRFELDSQLTRIAELQRDIGIPLADIPRIGPSETEAYRENFARAMKDLSQAKALVEQHERKLEDVQGLLKRHEVDPDAKTFEFGVEDRMAADPRVSALRARLVEGEAALAVLAERFREGSPQLVVEQEANNALRGKLVLAERSVRGERLDSIAANVQQELSVHRRSVHEAETRKEEFRGLLDDFDVKAASVSTALAELEELKMRAEETRSQLRNVRQTIAAISIENQAPARVKRLTAPTVPLHPDYATALQLIALVIGGSISMGVLAGLWREMTDEQARAPEDVSSVTPLPVLAAIPYFDPEQFEGPVRPPLLCADFPESPGADEYRRILSRIVYPPDGIVEVSSCLIASAMRGDGKTSLASNLSINLAQTNREVLLVDVCPRDPSIEKCFDLEPSEGLAEVLDGSRLYETLVRATSYRNLKVMGPGLNHQGIAGKLASREMMEFLERVEEAYDHVIIDSPPALLMSDTKLLAPVVDGVIVVVGVETSSLGMLKRLLRELDQVNANVIGLVLNGLRPTRGGYLRTNVDLYNRYGDKMGNGHSKDEFPDMDIAEEGPEEAATPAMLLLGESEGGEPGSKKDPET